VVDCGSCSVPVSWQPIDTDGSQTASSTHRTAQVQVSSTSPAMDNPLQLDLDHILEHTRELWEQLRGGRIFVTGGTGFFGRWLLESFVWANDRLGLRASAVVLTRNPDVFLRKASHLIAHPAIEVLSGDIRAFEFPMGRFDCVVHAAADSGGDATTDRPVLVFDTIVSGTRRVLDFACSTGAKRVLLTSSGAVYGTQPPQMVQMPETHTGGPDPLDPRWLYGEAKRAAETICCAYARQRGLEPTIARCFAFVGPYLPLDAHFAIGNFIRDGLCGGPIRVLGDGTPHRSYLYAADLAAWLWTILFRGSPCVPYNVGSDDGRPIAEWADVVARAFTPRPAVQIGRDPIPGNPSERYVPTTARARQQLGLEQWIDAPTGIVKSVTFSKPPPT
jgi:nucleoside-diphosphate-sugar epimerase